MVHHPRQGVEMRGDAQQLRQLGRHLLVHGTPAGFAHKLADLQLQLLDGLELAPQAHIGLGHGRGPGQRHRVEARGLTRQLHGQMAQARQFMAQRLQRQHRHGRHVAVQVARPGRILVC